MKNTNLTFKTSKVIDDISLEVKISLDDECGNGHQDFSITGLYGKTCGCIHEFILEHFPQFKIFVDLHLHNYLGQPMYPIINGKYYLEHPENYDDDTIMRHFMCSKEMIPTLRASAWNKELLALTIKHLGLLELWKSKADTAILILENLIGEEFEPFSNPKIEELLSPEKLCDIEKRLECGFFDVLKKKHSDQLEIEKVVE